MSALNRLMNLLRRRDLNRDIDEELQFHLDCRVEDNIAAGMTEREARRDAYMRFGGRRGVREQTRDTHVLVLLESVLQDVRFGVRNLVRQPLFSLVALATLALGIGANSAVLTIVRSVLLRPLPFPDSDRLFVITNSPPGSRFWLYPSLPDTDYLAFRQTTPSFAATATFGVAPATLTGAGDAVRVNRTTVTADFLLVLRVAPRIGRDFAAGEDRPGSEPVVLVSDDLWRTRFAADPSLVERQIVLDGVGHRVLGILPPGFHYPAESDVWTPLAVTITPGIGYSRPVIGRLRDGVTEQQAASTLHTLGGSARLIPLREAMVGDTRLSLVIFSGAVAFVLLIACANVTNLLLMRAVSRRQEIVTRLALGAGRMRIVRQLVTESLVLSIAGGLGGIVLAQTAVPALLTLMPPGRLPSDLAVRMDGIVLASMLGISILTGLALGLMPALQATRADVAGRLREGIASPGRRSHWLRHCLVVTEVALALILLVGAGLLVRSFLNLRAVPTGFDPSNVLTMTVDLPDQRYATADRVIAFHEELLGALRAIPGAQSVSAVNWMPLGPMVLRGDFAVEDGRELPRGFLVTKAAVGSQYFRAMGIRLVEGRDFADTDDARADKVVIVSGSVASRIWAGENAIGRRLSLETGSGPRTWLTIVGVVDDVRQGGVKSAFAPAVYQPYGQVTRPSRLAHMTFVVRTNEYPERLAPMMRGALRAIDRDQAPQSVVAMEEVLGHAIAEPRFQSRLLGVFSLVAVALAAIGIYGVLAASVIERSREIGIRVALGANRGTVVRLVMGRTLLLTGAGILLGMIGALLTTQVLTRLLFNVTPTDPVVLAAAAGALAAVALVAGFLPARRATSVDPLIALRAQ